MAGVGALVTHPLTTHSLTHSFYLLNCVGRETRMDGLVVEHAHVLQFAERYPVFCCHSVLYSPHFVFCANCTVSNDFSSMWMLFFSLVVFVMVSCDA
jgi:hypothetical protein